MLQTPQYRVVNYVYTGSRLSECEHFNERDTHIGYVTVKACAVNRGKKQHTKQSRRGKASVLSYRLCTFPRDIVLALLFSSPGFVVAEVIVLDVVVNIDTQSLSRLVCPVVLYPASVCSSP